MKRLALAFALLLAACGEPSATYVTNKDLGVYFTVPSTWNEISERALDQAEFDQIDSAQAQQRYDLVRWQTAFAPSALRAKDVLATDPREFPVVFVRVRDLADAERNTVSLNTLRDLVFPVTSAANSLPIVVDADTEVSQEGGAGVDLSYEITLNEKAQRLRQIALLSKDRRVIYLLVVRCSSTCFAKNIDQINQIADSFTVRGARV